LANESAAARLSTVDGSAARQTQRKVVSGLCAVAVVMIFGGGFLSGRAWEVPGKTAFWTLAAQPMATVTAGILAIAAATVALYGVYLSNADGRVRSRAEIKQRDDAAKSGELWKRFEWVVDRLTKQESGSSSIDEDQAADIVISIRDAAETCGDSHLWQMLDVYMGGQIEDLSTELGL
jgi:hypothetical protein